MRAWKTLLRQPALDCGKFLTVEQHTVETPSGQVIENWPWVITPDYVNIVTITEQNEFLCFRQNKYAVQGESLAPVGGYIDPGEEPLIAAQRELLEETGYQAAEWVSLGAYPVDGNRGAGTAYLFLARRAHQMADRHADDLEDQELVRLSRQEAQTALIGGQFKLLPWMAAMALALLRETG